MKRKLIKQAGQALTITLPIEWIRDNGLKPGDEIELEQIEKNLVLKSDKKILTGSIKLNMNNFNTRMKYSYINSIYARGIDEIKLISDAKHPPDLNQNIGYAVLVKEGDIQIIRDVSGVTSENLDDIFKRVFQMIMSFYDSAIDDIFGDNNEKYENVRKFDVEINKFTLFLQRSIMKLSYPDPAIGRIMFAFSFNLEKIGDEILRMWRINIKEKVKKDKEVKEIVLLSREMLHKAFEIYYRATPEKIKEIIALRNKIRDKSTKLFNINPSTAKFLMHAIKISDDSTDLSHLSIMKTI